MHDSKIEFKHYFYNETSCRALEEELCSLTMSKAILKSPAMRKVERLKILCNFLAPRSQKNCCQVEFERFLNREDCLDVVQKRVVVEDEAAEIV